MTAIDFPGGFNLDGYGLHGWTDSLWLSRQTDRDGAEVFVCWTGTFDLVTNDGGGWMPEDGVAAGFSGDGRLWLDHDWTEHATARPENGAINLTPFAAKAAFAQAVAAWAPLVQEAVEKAFEVGADMEQVLASLQKDIEPGDLFRAAMTVAFGLLWVIEDERRDAAS